MTRYAIGLALVGFLLPTASSAQDIRLKRGLDDELLKPLANMLLDSLSQEVSTGEELVLGISERFDAVHAASLRSVAEYGRSRFVVAEKVQDCKGETLVTRVCKYKQPIIVIWLSEFSELGDGRLRIDFVRDSGPHSAGKRAVFRKNDSGKWRLEEIVTEWVSE